MVTLDSQVENDVKDEHSSKEPEPVDFIDDEIQFKQNDILIIYSNYMEAWFENLLDNFNLIN